MPAVEEIILGDAPQEVVLGDAPAATATMERPQQQPKQWQGVSLSPTLQEEQKFNEQLGIPKPEMGTFPYDEVVAETAKQARELVEGRAKKETFYSYLSEIKNRFGMQFYNQAIVPIVNTALSLPQKGAMPAIEKAMGQKPTKPLQISPLELYQPKEGETPLPETAIDIGAGLSAFGTKLAVASAIGIPAPLAWEAINLNSGGTPGEGLLQYYTFKNIGGLPAETILGKLAKTGAESSALMAITSSGKDATIKDTFVMGAIPWASAGLRILRSGGSMKQAINVIKTEKPELKVVPEVEMEKMLKSATALQRQVPTMTTEPTTMPTKPSGLPVEAVKPAKPTKLPTVDELLAKTGISRAQLENAQINRGQPWADEIIAKVEAQIPPPSEFSIAEMKPLWDELKLKYHELGTARIEAARGMAGGFADVGKAKTSGLAQHTMERAVEAGIKTDFGQLPEYNMMNMADQARQALTLVKSNPESAKKIAMGQEQPQGNLRSGSVYKAVEEQAIANKDVDTILNLSKSKLSIQFTAMGQQIKALDTAEHTSPVKVIRDIQKVREESMAKKVNLVRERQRIMGDIKETIRKTSGSRQNWAEFIESIRCN